MNPLKSNNPEELGFDPGVPGHRLMTPEPWHSNPAYGIDDYKFRCSCGELDIFARRTANGGVGRAPLRTFKEHIEAVSADPDEVVVVGRVKKPRVTWEVKIISRNYQYAQQYVDASPRWSGWTSGVGWTGRYPWAIVIDKTSKRGKTSKAFHTVAQSRGSAYRKATEMIAKHEHEFEIEYEGGGDLPSPPVPVVVPTFRNTFSDLLARTDVSLTGDISEVQQTMQEIDEVLSLVPVLQARRDELAEIWDQRTTGLLK